MKIEMRRFAMAGLLILAGVFSADFLLTAYEKYTSTDPAAYALFTDRQGWLFTHLAGGVLTLVLGPIQFLTQGLATARPVHRWMGRVYLLGLLVASVGAMGLISTSPAPLEIRVAFAATMLVWLATAAVALRAIRSGQRQLHRRWMVRNYLITLAPVAFRLLLRAALALGVAPSPALITALLWAGWLVPLVAWEALALAPPLRRLGSTARPSI